MFIKRVVLENFQSHSYTELFLDKNLNTIVGMSNTGKSSISRALASLLFGIWDKSWVKHGSKFARIVIETSDGIIVERKKGEKINHYSITLPNGNTEIFDSIGTSVPESVQQALKIHEIGIDDKETVNLNHAMQMDNLFMLSKTGSFNARLLGKLSGAHYLDFSIKDLNNEKRIFSQEKTAKEKELVDINAQIEKFQLLESLSTKITEIEAKLTSIIQREGRLQQIRGLFERVNAWKQTWSHETKIEGFLAPLKVINIDVQIQQASRILALRNLLTKVTSWKKSFENASSKIVTMRAIELPDFQTKLDRVKKLKDLSRKLNINSSNIINLEKTVDKNIADCKHNKEEYENLLRNAGVCPLCGVTTINV